MLNALTIDVEDYFQVHAFSKVIKCDDWDGYECRIERNVDRILDVLSGSIRNPQSAFRNRVKGTFFVLGWIAERYPDLVQKIQKEGHEIACHGYAHKLIYNQSKEEFRKDIRKAKAMLEDITGSEVIGYRAPGYSITDKSQWAFEILKEEGFKYDSSIFPIRHDFYGFPNAPRFPFLISLNGANNYEFSVLNYEVGDSKFITHNSKLKINNSSTHSPSKSSRLNVPIPQSAIPGPCSAEQTSLGRNPHSIIEFPISTVRLLGQNLPISGGGYFRLFPYTVIEKGLKNINEGENKPFIFYIHPWELDPDQPKINGLSLKSKFRHYVNLDKTGDRFKKLLRDFNFSPVRDILELSDVLTQ